MVAMLAPVLAGTVKTMAMSFLSEKLLQEVVLLLLRTLVNSTKNDLDNKLLAAYEKQLGKK
tara:strand:+ start:392 stop:574 length:183 start_codon:yes stop_codon:yes gene_type:complete